MYLECYKANRAGARCRFAVVSFTIMTQPRGALIVFEGTDKSGKTTQCKKLVQFLNDSGHLASLFLFPDRTTRIGQLIDAYLKKGMELEDHAIHLLFSANRWECMSQIERYLREGVTVVMDRYAFSGVAFSAAKSGMSLDWCKQTDSGLPNPDICFFLNASPESISKREDFGSERYETAPFQSRVLLTYQQLLHDKTINWHVIDAVRDLEEIHREIKCVVLKLLQQIECQPLGRLWE